VGTCDLCHGPTSFLNRLIIRVDGGSRSICRTCHYRLKATPTPAITDETCGSTGCKWFLIFYAPSAVVVCLLLAVIAVTQCAKVEKTTCTSSNRCTVSRVQKNDAGCFAGMFVLGFLGGCFLLFFPLMFFAIRHANIEQKRMGMAFKMLQSPPSAIPNLGYPGGGYPVAIAPSAPSAPPLFAPMGQAYPVQYQYPQHYPPQQPYPAQPYYQPQQPPFPPQQPTYFQPPPEPGQHQKW
jgi:hypothetical protein